MRNTDFMNLSLPEGADKIDVEILNSDFTAIENLLEQHAIIETMTLDGEGVIIGAIGPYIRLQNIDTVQVSVDIGNETYTLASGENVIIRETAENIGIITSGNVHITYFVNPKTYADKGFYTKEKVDELLSNVEATVEVDAELSETSENPVQNKVIAAALQEQINNLLSVKTHNHTCFTKDETQTNLNVRTDMFLKENAFAWMFNPHITSISKIPANTRTVIGTVSPTPPRRIIKQNVTIYKDDNSATLTNDAIIDIYSTGVVHITSPVAIREDGVTGDYGRININTCFLEAIKFDFVANTTTEGGE